MFELKHPLPGRDSGMESDPKQRLVKLKPLLKTERVPFKGTGGGFVEQYLARIMERKIRTLKWVATTSNLWEHS